MSVVSDDAIIVQSFTYTCLLTLPFCPIFPPIHHHFKIFRMLFSLASSTFIKSLKTPHISSKLFSIQQLRGQPTGGTRNMSTGRLFFLLSLPPAASSRFPSGKPFFCGYFGVATCAAVEGIVSAVNNYLQLTKILALRIQTLGPPVVLVLTTNRRHLLALFWM